MRGRAGFTQHDELIAAVVNRGAGDQVVVMSNGGFANMPRAFEFLALEAGGMSRIAVAITGASAASMPCA